MIPLILRAGAHVIGKAAQAGARGSQVASAGAQTAGRAAQVAESGTSVVTLSQGSGQAASTTMAAMQQELRAAAMRNHGTMQSTMARIREMSSPPGLANSNAQRMLTDNAKQRALEAEKHTSLIAGLL